MIYINIALLVLVAALLIVGTYLRRKHKCSCSGCISLDKNAAWKEIPAIAGHFYWQLEGETGNGMTIRFYIGNNAKFYASAIGVRNVGTAEISKFEGIFETDRRGALETTGEVSRTLVGYADPRNTAKDSFMFNILRTVRYYYFESPDILVLVASENEKEESQKLYRFVRREMKVE